MVGATKRTVSLGTATGWVGAAVAVVEPCKAQGTLYTAAKSGSPSALSFSVQESDSLTIKQFFTGLN